jgi:hypothetical protein
MVDDPSRHDAIPHTRFVVPGSSLSAVFFGIILVCSIAIIGTAITHILLGELQIPPEITRTAIGLFGGPQSPPEIMKTAIVGLVGIVFAVLCVYRLEWEVETRDEGLYVLYLLRNSQIIQWSRIREMSLSVGWLNIYGDGKIITPLVQIPIKHYDAVTKRAADDLIDRIARLARLTNVNVSVPGIAVYYRDE